MRESTRKFTAIRNALLAIAVCLQLAATTAGAQDARDSGDQADPPDRVARLSYLKGKVSFESEDEPGWVEGTVNRPLTTGDRVRLERNARAELQTGPLDVQVDEQSEFSFLELTDTVAQMSLTEGALYVSVRRIREDEVVEIDTPHAAVQITKPGEYAISIVGGGSRTIVRAYSGECEVTNHQESLTLNSREQAVFDGSTGRPPIESASSRNAFDSWAHDRAVRGERSASSRYVGPDVIGYSDLDEYGDWVSESDYGYVWIPRHVAVGWSPYSYGRWTWVSPWGWTWVDDAPWGFAPFHYGRWAHLRSRWVWVPGPLHVRPVYAPALVAWVGAAPPRSSVSFSIAFGSGIGWFPLAPREIFVPSYHCSRRHIYNVNYANTVVVNNVYINRAYNDRSTFLDHVNRRVDGAVTVVRPEAFRGSRPVREHIVRVDNRDLRNWQTRNSIADVQEVRERQANWRDGVRNGPPREQGREVVMRRSPQQSAVQNAMVRQGNQPNRESNNRGSAREPNRGDGRRETMNRDANDANTNERANRQFGAGGSQTQREAIDNPSRSRGNWRERTNDAAVRAEPTPSAPAAAQQQAQPPTERQRRFERPAERQVERQVDRPVERTRESSNEERSRNFERSQPQRNEDSGARQQRYEARQERSMPPMRESQEQRSPPPREQRQESRQEQRQERQEQHDGSRGSRERFR